MHLSWSVTADGRASKYLRIRATCWHETTPALRLTRPCVEYFCLVYRIVSFKVRYQAVRDSHAHRSSSRGNTSPSHPTSIGAHTRVRVDLDRSLQRWPASPSSSASRHICPALHIHQPNRAPKPVDLAEPSAGEMRQPLPNEFFSLASSCPAWRYARTALLGSLQR